MEMVVSYKDNRIAIGAEAVFHQFEAFYTIIKSRRKAVSWKFRSFAHYIQFPLTQLHGQ